MNNEVIKNTKIAIISDIHGNYQALKAVIEDIDSKGIDNIICLGDIIGKGFNTRKCIDLVKSRCSIVLKGNTDDRFSSNPDDFKNNRVEYNRIKFHQQLLTTEDIDYLKNLPLYTEFYLSGNLVRLFHASINNPYRYMFNYELDFRRKYELFKPDTPNGMVADIIIYGHMHYQFLEKIYGKSLINCGSVGCSGCPVLEDGYNSEGESSDAHYLIISGNLNDKNHGKIEFSFESVLYDKEKELADSKAYSDVLDEISPGYEKLLKEGYYPELPKVMKNFTDDGYKLFNTYDNK